VDAPAVFWWCLRRCQWCPDVWTGGAGVKKYTGYQSRVSWWRSSGDGGGLGGILAVSVAVLVGALAVFWRFLWQS